VRTASSSLRRSVKSYRTRVTYLVLVDIKYGSKSISADRFTALRPLKIELSEFIIEYKRKRDPRSYYDGPR